MNNVVTTQFDMVCDNLIGMTAEGLSIDFYRSSLAKLSPANVVNIYYFSTADSLESKEIFGTDYEMYIGYICQFRDEDLGNLCLPLSLKEYTAL